LEGRGELASLLESARAAGARAAEVVRSEWVAGEQRGARQRLEESRGRAYRVRVYRADGATGEADASDGPTAVRTAIDRAGVAPADPHAGPVERMLARSGALGVDDRRWSGVEAEDRSELLHLAERALERTRGTLAELCYRQERRRRCWMSTRGMEAEEHATTFRLSALARLDALDVAQVLESRHFSDVASLPFGPELRRRVEALGLPGQAPTGPLPWVLEPRVFAGLVRELAACFTPASGSFVELRHGEPLAGSALHVTDDAGLYGGLRSRSFDDRGVPPIAVTLLKEGVVHGFYHSPESARRHGLRPTGHVWGEVLRPSNLVVRPGARTRNVILGELGAYLAPDRLPPLDPATGRLRGVVPVFLCDRHERRSCVRMQVDWAVDALLRAIDELAADQERNDDVDAPTAVLNAAVGEGAALA